MKNISNEVKEMIFAILKVSRFVFEKNRHIGD